MLIELKKKIEEIIKVYQENTQQCIAEIKKVIDEWKDQVNTYKPEYIKKQVQDGISEALEDSKKVNKVYNQKLKAIIEEVKQQILPEYVKKIKKSADYATQVNNALQFIIIEGDSITDDKAYMILKDFIDDPDQMKLFKNVIGKRAELEDHNGNTTFPKTFGKLNKIEVVLNTFNEIECIANMLFIYEKEEGQTFVMNGEGYSLPIEPYEQMAGEDDIINLADVVESIAKEVPGIESITDQTDHETTES